MFAALSDLVATAVAAASPRGLDEEQERAEALVDKARARVGSGNAPQRNARPLRAAQHAPPAPPAVRGTSPAVPRVATLRRVPRIGVMRRAAAPVARYALTVPQTA